MTFKEKLYKIIFETDTRAGKKFDVVLLWLILISVLVVMLESIPEIVSDLLSVFHITEWFLTILFTIEYLTRIWVSKKPMKYIFSFWGLIDFLSILPTYLSLFVFGYHYLLVVRIFRLLRIFRILKLARFSREAQILLASLRTSMYKISIFLLAVIAIVTFLGTIMYVIEGGKEGFTSIPQSIYWAIVTVTTVGYGDMVPHTVLGKIVSSVAMIIGYAIIAVPTGIITIGMVNSSKQHRRCSHCRTENDISSNYCSHCGQAFKN